MLPTERIAFPTAPGCGRLRMAQACRRERAGEGGARQHEKIRDPPHQEEQDASNDCIEGEYGDVLGPADEIALEQGAIMMCSSATSLHALRKARLSAGERIRDFPRSGSEYG